MEGIAAMKFFLAIQTAVKNLFASIDHAQQEHNNDMEEIYVL